MISPCSSETMAGSQTCSTQSHMVHTVPASELCPVRDHLSLLLYCVWGKLLTFRWVAFTSLCSCAFVCLYAFRGLQDLPNHCFSSKNASDVQDVTHRLTTKSIQVVLLCDIFGEVNHKWSPSKLSYPRLVRVSLRGKSRLCVCYCDLSRRWRKKQFFRLTIMGSTHVGLYGKHTQHCL